jgi:tetratricopeptide (TPR) repeat protein
MNGTDEQPIDVRAGVTGGVFSWTRGFGESDASLLAILALCAFLPYANTLFNAFVYDDNTQVLNNPYIQSFSHLREIFTTTVWSYVGAQGLTNYFRPLMTFGYLICFQIFGPLAYGFHLANVLLHVGVVCVLFLLTARLFGSRLVAFVAALLFALHPVHTESVAWIAAVTDLELTLFYLLTFLLFLRIARPGGGRSDKVQLAMVGSFVLTMLSKEQALTLPFLAMVYEHSCRDDRAETTPLQKLHRYGFLWLLAAAYLLFRVRFFGAIAPVLQISDLSWSQTILSSIALIGQYLGKLLWPADLCAFYVFYRSTSFADPRVLAGAAAIVCCLLVFAILWRYARRASFAVVWFFVTLAPVLNPRWMAANVFTERYLYLPSVAFCWLVAWGWVRLWESSSARPGVWRPTLAGALAVIAVVYAARLVTRNRDWRDDIRLYTKTLAVSPDSYHIHNNLGTVYWKQGSVEAAEREWRTAFGLAPHNVVILNNLGLALSKREEYKEAVSYFQRAMRRKPNYTDPHLNLGMAYREMKLVADAELQLRAAVALSPLNVYARNQLGELYVETGRSAEAEEQFLHSVKSEPNVVGYDALGDIYVGWKDSTRAKSAFQRAASIDPFDSHARFSLGRLYLAEGRAAEALQEFLAGLQSDPKNEEIRAMLGKLKSKGNDAAH